MINTNHTPGPWTINLSFDAAMRREIWTETDPATGHRELVALIPDAEGEHINADARLIATAPEMLDLLYKVLPFIEDAELDSTYKPGVVAEVTRQIRDTIQKAGGAL